MLKSSSSTFVFKYLFPVFMCAGIILGIFLTWTEGTPESQNFAKAMIVISVWILIFLVQMPFRLKYIEATESGLLVKDFGKQSLIEYKDIEWITKFDFSSPWFITIKYRIAGKDVSRKISFIPSQQSQKFFENDEMSEFIKNKIISENKHYSKDVQPSPLKNLFLLMILALPFMVLALYFFNGF